MDLTTQIITVLAVCSGERHIVLSVELSCVLTGMDLGQLGVSHVDGTTNDGGFDSEDMYLMHPGLHDGGEGHGEELFEPVAPKVTGGTRSRPAKPAAKAKSPVVTPKKKQCAVWSCPPKSFA